MLFIYSYKRRQSVYIGLSGIALYREKSDALFCHNLIYQSYEKYRIDYTYFLRTDSQKMELMQHLGE